MGLLNLLNGYEDILSFFIEAKGGSFKVFSDFSCKTHHIF